ncbi:MAG: hypothetical protein PF447_04015 [Spirochaetaceae bacterium]|jgi:hypothetical protein|nr:hypothetical protein [Spirochaetaceae bacterium]
MIRISEKEEKELVKLTVIVMDKRKELALQEIAQFFKSWSKNKRDIKKADDKIQDYYHLNESLKTSDNFLLVADAISDGVITQKELSKELYTSLEVVVKMLKG